MNRLSTLQFNMLRHFAERATAYHMSIEQAQHYDQRPFRSMLVREWIAYRAGRGFHITRAGIEAFRDFQEHSIERKNPALPLTTYFDPTAYDIKPAKRKAAA